MIQVILILSNWWPKFWNRRFVFIAASGLGRVLSSSKIENSCPKSGPDLGDTLSLNSLASSFYGMIPHKVFKLVLMLKIIGFIPIATDYTIAMQNLMLQVSYVIIIIIIIIIGCIRPKLTQKLLHFSMQAVYRWKTKIDT